MNGWTRVTFLDHGAYAEAMGIVTRVGLQLMLIAQQNPATHMSVWTVNAMNALAGRALGGPAQPVPGDLQDMGPDSMYLYFPPGTAPVFRQLLPANWVYDQCATPPAQFVSLLVGDDRDRAHFGFRQP